MNKGDNYCETINLSFLAYNYFMAEVYWPVVGVVLLNKCQLKSFPVFEIILAFLLHFTIFCIFCDIMSFCLHCYILHQISLFNFVTTNNSQLSGLRRFSTSSILILSDSFSLTLGPVFSTSANFSDYLSEITTSNRIIYTRTSSWLLNRKPLLHSLYKGIWF